MRSLWLTDACRGSQVHAVSPVERVPQSWLQVESAKCSKIPETHSSLATKLANPPIEPHFKPVDYVEMLAQIHEELETAAELDKAGLYLVQSFVFRGLGETKLLRRSLKAALTYATTALEKLIFKAWLKFEKRGEALNDEFASHQLGYECQQVNDPSYPTEMVDCDQDSCANIIRVVGNEANIAAACCTLDRSVEFLIGSEVVLCDRQKMASLSFPFHAMLNGCFTESRISCIDFSQNGISVEGMRFVNEFSRTGRLGHLQPNLLLEVLAFANKFCCEKMKNACDSKLAALVQTRQDAVLFMEYGLEESAQALIASCLKVILEELPGALQDPGVVDLLCSDNARRKHMIARPASFALFALLSEVSMEEDSVSDLSILLLQCLIETAMSGRQKALALHWLGCIMLDKQQFREAQEIFEAAAREGHTYSLAGVARAKYEQGQRHAAFMEINCVLCRHKPTGWMYMERSLYCDAKERLDDLNRATELDPTLIYPYKYRAAMLMDEQKINAAIVEIDRILGFKVASDCLELRFYFCLALADYAGAVRDVRALLTLDPKYTLYSGRVSAVQLLTLLSPHVEQWTVADCWLQLYNRWSSVDDIGSLAVVHQMLESDPGKGLLFFRQSLLLLRLNCPKTAMHSLQLACRHANSEHERLVYEGWILYDTGLRDQALRKAEESISIHRSFEAFFLKAYAMADTSLDPASSAHVVELLEEALKCPSDGLRKGQAWNNLGSVYVDCGKLDLAEDCYVSALNIRHTRAHQGLARVFYLKNDKVSAYEEMTKLIEKAQYSASAYEKRSEYCERDKTMADLSMVTRLDPLRTYPYRYRAAVLMDSHQEQEAIAELSRAIAFKADLHLLHLRAAFHECIGDVAGALRDCRAALSVDPNHHEIMELHSRVHSREP